MSHLDSKFSAQQKSNRQIRIEQDKTRQDKTGQTSVAVTPEAKRGTIVSYMSGNTFPTTPRRGEGKKKTRATEDLDDDAEDKNIQDNFDAIQKLEAAARQTMKEMSVDMEKNTDSNKRRANGSTKSKEPPTTHPTPHSEPTIRARQANALPEASQNDEGDVKNPSSNTNPQKEDHTKGNPKEKNKKKRKPHKKRQKKKQSHILQAGPNGKAQLAGATPGTEDVNDEEEEVKDKKFYDRLIKDREREFNFRVNFILLLEDATGALDQKKAKAIHQLKIEVSTFSPLDPTLVVNPLRRSSPIIAPPLKIEDFDKDTTLHRYCKTV